MAARAEKRGVEHKALLTLSRWPFLIAAQKK